MIHDILEMFGAGFLLVMALMIGLWIFSYFKKNAGIVDIGWALAFLISSWAYFLLGDGDFAKKLVLTGMVTIWGGRLAWHLIQRFHPDYEDPRYTVIRKKLGKAQEEFKMLMLFLFQGFLVIILTTPFVMVCANAEASWHWLEVLGILVWGIGVAGEAVADYQLDQFKRNHENKDKVCDVGLWGRSRHPNYFFEFVVWIGFFLFALPTTLGELAIISPALIYYLLVYVSGVPLAEEQSLKTRGEVYRDYQKRTNPFFPWPKKKAKG